jgi:hypothetical protein
MAECVWVACPNVTYADDPGWCGSTNFLEPFGSSFFVEKLYQVECLHSG